MSGSARSLALPVLWRAVALVALLGAGCGSGDGGGETAAPNPLRAGNGRPVILISIDSLRADRCTPYGHRPQFAPDEATTPLLDRLAQAGVLWENASAPTSWTLPSHVSLLGGMPPQQHGVHIQSLRVPAATEFVAGRFQQAGYLTAGFFSGPYLHPVWGFGAGFDRYAGAARYLNERATTDAVGSAQRGGMDEVNQRADSIAETAAEVVDHALRWLETERRYRQPFFLFLHFWDPHYDYRPPAELAERFHPGWQGLDGRDVYTNWRDGGRVYSAEEVDHLRALYDAEIRYTDDQLARLYAQLEAWGVAEQAILAVVSDHGDEFFEHGSFGHHKTLHEEVLHVPMLLAAPGLVPAGRRLRGSAPIYDLAPTLLDLAGLAAWPERSGRSLRPMWEQEDADRAVLLQLHHPGAGAFLKGWRRGPDKVLFQWMPENARARWAYDLATDPGELAPATLASFGETATGQAAFAALQAADAARMPVAEKKDFASPAELEAIARNLAEVGYVQGEDE